MSKTIRRRSARYEYRWVLSDWVSLPSRSLLRQRIAPHSSEGRKRLAKFHSDSQRTMKMVPLVLPADLQSEKSTGKPADTPSFFPRGGLGWWPRHGARQIQCAVVLVVRRLLHTRNSPQKDAPPFAPENAATSVNESKLFRGPASLIRFPSFSGNFGGLWFNPLHRFFFYVLSPMLQRVYSCHQEACP